MPAIPAFLEMIEQMREIHSKKNEDYSSGGAFENFERSATIASWFQNDDDKSFAVLIGTKLARLGTLLSKDGDPNCESIDDSFLDLATYAVLWGSYHRQNTTRIFKQVITPVKPEKWSAESPNQDEIDKRVKEKLDGPLECDHSWRYNPISTVTRCIKCGSDKRLVENNR